MNNGKDLENKFIAEAAAWRLLGLLFECPSEDWKNEISTISKEVSDEKLVKAAELALTEGSEGLYHSIFGPGGPAPCREVSYRSWVQPGPLLSEIRAFYNAFGFAPDTPETPDHVSVEAAFVAYLKLKQAYALSLAADEHVRVTAEAVDNFLKGHLSKIAGPLSASLSRSGVEYLSIAGECLGELAGADPDSASTRRFLPVIPDEEANFECGPSSGEFGTGTT
ncbi:MAG: hypothetical protein DWQ47_08660 [Acidobacteria bacterium]|nr:MAG: hypothetical protein DWQ32_16760 [Acidobacteriota bacterium]REJ99020.1 MAG: hypothetical protein DWQ38_13220 [Acidobacteriota bacterium]REK16259.1 MAG: hypothetical protein DWQ43_04470 [Acidobacteriota bacterium]REK43940.1 MAG: hypothetical protein DWQ47_08660 [Acidobacteriota bacterium]